MSGNLFKLVKDKKVVVAHPVMSFGIWWDNDFARSLRERHSKAESFYYDLYYLNALELGSTKHQIISRNFILGHMVAIDKFEAIFEINYAALARCFVGVREVAEYSGLEIYMPKFIANWDFVGKLIEDSFGDIPVNIVEHKE